MGNCESGSNNIGLVEKHKTEDKDELKKAMKLFNLEENEDGREKGKNE